MMTIRDSIKAHNRYRLMCTVLSCAILGFLTATGAGAEEISVGASVESRDVYMGESFLMQVSVNGADEADPPDLSSLEGFNVEYMGGSNNSSHSISIINGRVERIVHKGFIFTYRLTPTRTGRLTIPSLKLNVGGETFTTDSIDIAVRRPAESEDFKLRIQLSRETCYVAEPVVMTVTWYLRRDVQSFNFTVPVLSSDAFTFENPEVKIDRRKKYFRVPIGDGEVIAEKGSGMLEGERYATLTFSKALIPKRAGTFLIPEVVVACEAVTGIRQSRDLFDDFFSDDFFQTRRGRLKKYVVPSNSLSLLVNDLPEAGRPDDFSGHVGEYRISVSADPIKVNVGDPITLRIVLEGPDYLGSVNLQPLASQEDLARDFKIPDERADGRIEGKRKIFSQTIRAKNDRVKMIPSLRLVYFDTKKQRYETALSDPIPIEVHETRIVTALDAEGIELGPAGTPLEKWKEGIAFNYEGPEVIVPQDFSVGSVVKHPSWLSALILPPALYLVLFSGLLIARRRKADPEARRAKGALKRLKGSLKSIGKSRELPRAGVCAKIMEAMREYLGDKLRLPGRTLTAGDVERILGSQGVASDIVERIKDVMSRCEAGAYAGDSQSAVDREELISCVREAVERLERAL